MSDYLETLRLISKRIGPKRHRACAYLERAGQRFCVDFGYENAIEKAREHWRKRRCSRRKAKG